MSEFWQDDPRDAEALNDWEPNPLTAGIGCSHDAWSDPDRIERANRQTAEEREREKCRNLRNS